MERTGHITPESLMSLEAYAKWRKLHKPEDEKRMIVILPPERYDDWLQSSAKDSGEFLRAWPAEWMAAQAPQQSGLL